MDTEHALPRALRALLTPAAYPHPVGPIELVQTHVSWVLLTGPFAYKIKRPVRFPFVDLRSAERRAFLCREELRLNRRFAAELYVDVCRITSEGGQARIGGQGEVVEHAVRMTQFRRDDELLPQLAACRVGPSELDAFGRSLAEIHSRLPVVSPDEPWGRPDQVRSLILENVDQCAEAHAPRGDTGALSALRANLSERLERRAPRLARRLEAGRVRECHGDLHARNVVVRDGRLLAFDCMEFAPAFRWIDVADEIAFLTADLEVQGYDAAAHAFLNGYLGASGDYDACRVLDVYKAHRSLVRAKVTALGAAGIDPLRQADLRLARRQCEAYVAAARGALLPGQPLLVLMGGLSGSGKTWVASRLAPLLGAIHLRSDVERKRLAGLPESARTASPVLQGLYAPEASAGVYERLAACAEDVLDGGYPAIVDATFGRRADRDRFRGLAARLGVGLAFVHCRADADELRRRVRERHALAADASEADLAVLAWQQANAEPLTPDEGLAEFAIDTTRGDPVPSIRDLAHSLRAGA